MPTKSQFPLWSKIAIWVVWFFVIVFWLMIFNTNSISSVSRDFFKQISNWNMNVAYAITSLEFQNNTTFDIFEKYIKDNNLENYKSLVRNYKEVKNDVWYLKWELKTKDDTKYPVEITLIKKDEKWRISWIKMNDGWFENLAESMVSALPSSGEAILLVTKTIWLFSDAIKKSDFSDFYNDVAEVWKKEITAEKLKDIFKLFIEKKVDLEFIKNTSPIFEKDIYIDKWVLFITWYYPIDWVKLIFNLWYYQENWIWKLIGIDLNVK